MNAGPPDLVGLVLGGRYRLLRPIGRGGMGAVYEAEQLDLARRVAVKVLSGADQGSVARLRREALTAGGLRSPHVVSVIDFQEPAGEPPFLVMELLEGEPLHAVIAREGRLEPARAVRIACQMLEALAVAHRAGLVHRDVKPANVWLSRTLGGEVTKLLDFGIVKHVAAPVPQTTVGALVGTPAYLSPEQLRGLEADARSDLHGVGVVLHEMLTGQRLFGGSNLFVDILDRVPAPVGHLVPGLAPGLSEAVARALAKDPDARFRTAEEMLSALAPMSVPSRAGEVAGPMRVDAPPTIATPGTAPPPAEERSSPLALYLVVVGAVVVLGGAAIVGLVLHLRGQASAAAPAIARPSATAAPAPPGPTVSAAPSAAPSVTASPLPSAARRPASPSPSATPGAAPGAVRSRCVARFGGFAKTVCVKASTPACQCQVAGKAGQRVCSTPLLPGRKCSADDDTKRGYGGAGKKTGDPCKGYLDEGAAPGVFSSGTLECDVCYGPNYYGIAVPGTPCRGTSKQGESGVGEWIADP